MTLACVSSPHVNLGELKLEGLELCEVEPCHSADSSATSQARPRKSATAGTSMISATVDPARASGRSRAEDQNDKTLPGGSCHPTREREGAEAEDAEEERRGGPLLEGPLLDAQGG